MVRSQSFTALFSGYELLSHPMQLSGSTSQSCSQPNLSQDNHPIGGVLAKPLFRPSINFNWSQQRIRKMQKISFISAAVRFHSCLRWSVKHSQSVLLRPKFTKTNLNISQQFYAGAIKLTQTVNDTQHQKSKKIKITYRHMKLWLRQLTVTARNGKRW